MIDLNEIIKLVKTGSCFCNSFNLRIKKAEEEIDPDIFKREIEESRTADEWIAQEEERRQQQGAPVPQLPGEILAPVNAFIKSNKREIEMGNRNDVATLQEILDPNEILYRLLKNNSLLQSLFANEITRQTSASDERSNLFVDAMMIKTESFLRGVAIAQDEETKRRKEEDRIRKKREQDVFAVADILSDPNIDTILTEKLSKMLETPDGSVAIFERMNMSHNKENRDKIFEASPKQFGAPAKKGKSFDQRINFFISHPDKIPLGIDAKTTEIIKDELSKLLNIEGEIDVIRGISMVAPKGGEGTAPGQARMVKVLGNLIGEQLLQTLLSLVNNLDQSVFDWLRKGFYEEKGRPSYDAPVGDEGRSIIQNLGDPTSKDVGEYQVSAADVKESSDVIGKIMTMHLMPSLKKAEVLGRDVVKSMREDAISKYKDSGEKKYLDSYKIAEKLNAFLAPVIDHIYDLLEEQGSVSRKNKKMMTYSNTKGKLNIPNSILRDIYDVGGMVEEPDPVLRELYEKEAEPGIDRTDHVALAERYLKRIKKGEVKPFDADWGMMVNYKYPKAAYANMGDLKMEIQKLYQPQIGTEHENNFDPIIIKLRKNTNYIDEDGNSLLERFAGVSDYDPENEKIRKIKDFIYMTLQQDSYYFGWLQTLGPKTKGVDKFVLNRKMPRDPHHQLKEDIGAKYISLLGYLGNNKDAEAEKIQAEIYNKPENYRLTPDDLEKLNNLEHYTKESLNVIISLLDHYSSVKNFLRNGRQFSHTYNGTKTNTELYYDLKGKKPPSHIEEAMKLFHEGLKESKKKRVGFPALETGGWYKRFFDEYSKFDSIFRKRDKLEERFEGKEEAEEEHYQSYNRRLLKYLNDPKYKLGKEDIEYQNKLRRITDLKKRKEVNDTVQAWRNNPDKHLPSEIYTLLGMSKFEILLTQFATAKKNIRDGYWGTAPGGKPVWVDGISDLKKKVIEVNKNLENMAIEQGLPKDRVNALRLAHAAYKRALIKIAALKRMKKLNIKVASINYINMAINKIEMDFDRYFNSLFS